MAYREDLDMGKITLISLVSVLVMIALLLFLQVLYFGFLRRQMASAKYNQPDADMTKYVADQQGQLMSIRVVDRERQVATIPIDAAMGLVVGQLQTDPSASVTGVPDPEMPADPAASGESGGDENESDRAEESASPEENTATDAEQPPTDDSPPTDDADKAATVEGEGESGNPPAAADAGSETEGDSETDTDAGQSEVEGGDPTVGGRDAGAGEEETNNVES